MLSKTPTKTWPTKPTNPLSRLSQLGPLSKLNTLGRDSRDTLFLLLVIVWLLLPQLPHLPLWCSTLALAVLTWRGSIAWTGRALPGRWWLLGLLALTMLGTLSSHQTLLGRDAGVTLLVVLLSLKTLELRARRDALVIFFLGFFCLLSNFFYSQSLFIALNMLLGLLGLLTVLVNAHMPLGRPPLMAAARTAAWLTVLGVPIMVLLFLLFPRLAPLWGVPNDALSGRSGLSASMEVGNIARLALDESIAMRIRFEKLPAPPRQDMYFRGPVLTDFDGRQWRPSRFELASANAANANLAVFGTPINYQITLEPTQRPWLFVMEAAASAPVLNGMQARMQSDLQWLVNRPVTDLLRYEVQSHVDFRHGPVTPVASLAESLALPAGFNPRTLAMAEEIRSDARWRNAGSAELVALVLDKLRTGGYRYTLEPGVYGSNSADEFWFDRKLGFCEHIASAFVLLMRAMDVPARIVTGYQGGEQNRLDDYWVVRQSDAHAWTEVWHEGRGWVRVDPTAAVAPGRTGAFERLTAAPGVVAQTLSSFSPDLLLRLRAGWEALGNGWNQWVLNYTQNQQLKLLKSLGFQSPSWEQLAYLLAAITLLSSALGSAWMLVLRGRQDGWLRLLNRAQKQLRKAGIDSPENCTARQLAALFNAKYGLAKPSLQSINDWLIALEKQRYASHNSSRSPATAAEKKRQLKVLSQEFIALQWPALPLEKKSKPPTL